MKPLTFGSLFAGIGGFDLGFERAGMRCAWQVEIDPFCRRVLAKHWPGVRRWDDVRTFPPEPKEDWTCDVICGGFPCQDISSAGLGAGINGERSGLWAEYSRILRVVRPRYAVIENVAALTFRGLGRVLGDLAAGGFHAEWSMLPACALGAPHSRERLFIVAYSDGGHDPGRTLHATNVLSALRGEKASPRHPGLPRPEDVARWVAAERQFPPGPSHVRRVVDGVSGRLDGLRGLGNAVVPQVAEWIGRRLVAAAGADL